MTPKQKSFENAFQYVSNSMGHGFKCRGQMWCKLAAEKLVLLTKNRLRGTHPSPNFVPNTDRSHSKFLERCRPLTCVSLPNLVLIGYGLPELFRKDWFFGPPKSFIMVQSHTGFQSTLTLARDRESMQAAALGHLRVVALRSTQREPHIAVACRHVVYCSAVVSHHRLFTSYDISPVRTCYIIKWLIRLGDKSIHQLMHVTSVVGCRWFSRWRDCLPLNAATRHIADLAALSHYPGFLSIAGYWSFG